MREIDKIYHQLCYNLIHNGEKVGNTRELRNVKITLHDITDNVVSIRNISPSYLFAEWIWYFKGRNDVKFISQFASKWKKISDDGITNNSAYGFLMREAYGFDQIKKIIELLKTDPNSRRAVINLNIPNEKVIETKDEPCTICLQFYIRKNKLYCTGIMRSNDIWFGFPYDIAFFTLLQRYIADSLSIEYGHYNHFVTSIHVYERNIKDINAIISNHKGNEIIYDYDKFFNNLDFVESLLKISINKCSPEFNKKYILTLAKKYFGYKEENHKNEN